MLLIGIKLTPRAGTEGNFCLYLIEFFYNVAVFLAFTSEIEHFEMQVSRKYVSVFGNGCK